MFAEFEDVVSRLEKGQLATFPGGVHPQDHKALSNQTLIAELPLAQEFVIPVRQHIGTDGNLLVRVGDKVMKGQPLTQSNQPFSVPVHAPTSGVITDITQHVTAHPSGLSELCVLLKADGQDIWTPLSPCEDYTSLEKPALIEKLCDAGISGMGGAGFPTHIKASVQKEVEFLIINGAECEPYITSDDRLMREHAESIFNGIDILSFLQRPKCVVVAIEDNKPEALEIMRKQATARPHVRVVSIETKYPAGGEKQLIQVVTGREVPRQGLPLDIGVTMFNVGTCHAISEAIVNGKPLIERVVTVTGKAVKRPGNYRTRLGTPVNHLLSQAGYLADKQKTPQVIMGGPMMGFTLNDAAVPVVKITNCLLVPETHELTQGEDERACIRCSACADACPATLLPQQLYWHSKAKEYDKAQEYNLFDCIECGACAYVCPSEIPLVHYYRKAKADIRLELDEKAKSEKAKERFEARKARLEQEKAEREEKHRKAKEARLAAADKPAKKAADAPADPAKDKVAAALARAKARKAAQAAAKTGTGEAAPAEASEAPAEDKKAAVAAAIARAKAKKAARTGEQSDATAPSPAEAEAAPADDRKAALAAAVARAKAKKAAREAGSPAAEAVQQQDAAPLPETSPVPENDVNDKKAAVAAAVARAKAKKAAREAGQQSNSQSDSAVPAAEQAAEPQRPEVNAEDSAADAKKKRIAAAVAKAKAKKAQRDADPKPDETCGDNSVDTDSAASADAEKSESDVAGASDLSDAEAEKKRRVAAAVARAKAKKAQRDNENNA